jgi:hypothetical protein
LFAGRAVNQDENRGGKGLKLAALTVLCSVLAILLGCSPKHEQTKQNPQEAWVESSTFQIEGQDLLGIDTRVAIGPTPLVAGERKEYSLYLWGDLAEITGKLIIIGVDKETTKTATLSKGIYSIPAKPKLGADNHIPLLINFPSPGVWRLDIFMDSIIFESIVVNVQ